MKRKALIIYCDNTPPSKILVGPPKDNENYRKFLYSNYGGAWDYSEIISIQNPQKDKLKEKIMEMKGSDYTLTIFTGHGDMQKNKWDTWVQYCQILNDEISIDFLKTDAPKKTIIIDSCSKYYIPTIKTFSLALKAFPVFEEISNRKYFREIYDNAIEEADKGLTVLYSTKENHASADTENGGAFLCSLLKVVDIWKDNNLNSNVFRNDAALESAANMISEFFPDTDQTPRMTLEKRKIHYPFAVKLTKLNG